MNVKVEDSEVLVEKHWAEVCVCNLTLESFSALSSVLTSNSSSLRELDLSDNKLQGFRSEAALCWTEESTLYTGDTEAKRQNGT
ncbi:hypothetical protein QTP86_019462 [Hemibagrus guttatus]|nr:hypothetical protein QTP86_019462 [Hemibagrus guttatus]